MQNSLLPIFQAKDDILDTILKNQVVIISSPTGSGKTTGLPIILNSCGRFDRLIGVTQPRRIACISISEYVNKISLQELGRPICSYKIRFNDTTNYDTKIKLMTDGILLQEMKLDRNLSTYSVIMIDEAHERTLNIDFILGLLKDLLQRRPDLKIVISSATINTKVFSQYFNNAPIVNIEGKSYPVELVYKPLISYDIANMLKQITLLVGSLVEMGTGDILIFLHGEKAIKDCCKELENYKLYNHLPSNSMTVIPIYSKLSREEQDRVFDRVSGIKVVVATNIAETSITIDGIRVVIDSGIVKINYYNHKNGTSTLKEVFISKSSAEQRKGRAGRTQAGICYRLYSEDDYDKKQEYTQEEIYRTDLSEVVLRISELGITDISTFDFISKPKEEELRSAIANVKGIGAIDKQNKLTKIGEMMIRFPLLPRHSRMIVEAIIRYPDVVEDVIVVVGFISNSSPFLLPQDQEDDARARHKLFVEKEGDFYSYLKMYDMFMSAYDKVSFCADYFLDISVLYEIDNVVKQLCDIVSTDFGVLLKSNRLDKRGFMLSLAAGLPDFICVKADRFSYKTKQIENIEIHPSSLIGKDLPEYIIVSEIVRTTRLFARSVSKIEKEWIKEFDMDLYIELKNLSKDVKKESDFIKRERYPKGSDNTIKIINKKVVLFEKEFLVQKKYVSLTLEQYEEFYSYYTSQPRLYRFSKDFDVRIVKEKRSYLKSEGFKTVYFFAKVFKPYKHSILRLSKDNCFIPIDAKNDYKIDNAIARLGKFVAFSDEGSKEDSREDFKENLSENSKESYDSNPSSNQTDEASSERKNVQKSGKDELIGNFRTGIATLYTDEERFWLSPCKSVYDFLKTSRYSLSLLEERLEELGKSSRDLSEVVKKVENLERALGK